MLRPMLTTALLPVISSVSPLFVAASMSDAPEAPMVKLDVYMETLCPGSALFVKEELPKLFVNELYSIIDLSIVPWVRLAQPAVPPVHDYVVRNPTQG